MTFIVSGILLLIYGLCLYKILMYLAGLVHHHKKDHPIKVYLICFLAAVPTLFGLLTILYTANGSLFYHFNATALPFLGLGSILAAIALSIIVLSSGIAPEGLLKKAAFIFFWLFFVLWNVGLWAVVTYSRRALRARIRAVYPSDGSYSYRYEPYYYDTTTSRMIVVPPELLNQTQDQPRQVSPDGME